MVRSARSIWPDFLVLICAQPESAAVLMIAVASRKKFLRRATGVADRSIVTKVIMTWSG